MNMKDPQNPDQMSREMYVANHTHRRNVRSVTCNGMQSGIPWSAVEGRSTVIDSRLYPVLMTMTTYADTKLVQNDVQRHLSSIAAIKTPEGILCRCILVSPRYAYTSGVDPTPH